MWQLRERWQADSLETSESVALTPRRWRGLGTFSLVAATGGLGGYLGSLAFTPISHFVIMSWAIGGSALAYLLLTAPREVWRLLQYRFIALRLSWRRRGLQRLAFCARQRLLSDAENSPTPQVIRDLGVAEFLAGDTQEAALQLGSALEINPESGSLLNDLAVVLAERGQGAQAAELLVRALATDSAETARLNCALVAPLVSLPETLEALLRSTREATGSAIHNNLGVSFARLGQWEKAEAEFTVAAGRNGGLPAAQINLGLASLHRGRLQEAADRLLAAERLIPGDPVLANCLGVVLARGGQFEAARNYLRRALQIDPASVALHNNLMAVEALAGHWHEALRGWNALVTGSVPVEVYYNLALARLATGDPGGAAASAGAVIAQGDSSAEAHTLLAVALWEAGQRAKALQQFRLAANSPGAGAAELTNLGRVLLLEGEVSVTRDLLEKASLAWPGDLEIQATLAIVYVSQAALAYRDGLPPDAVREWRRVLERSLSGLETGARHEGTLALETQVNLGLYHYMTGHYEQAAEHFGRALQAAPRSHELAYLVGTCLGRAGERYTMLTGDGAITGLASGHELLRRAVPYLEQACAAREIMADAAYNLGRCQYVLEDFHSALIAFRKALTVERSEELYSFAGLAAARHAQDLKQKARSHPLMTEAKREQLRERITEMLNAAVHYLTQALTRNDLNPVLHGNLGIAYMMRNREHDIESALRHWERMRTLGGGAMESRYAELAEITGAEGTDSMAFADTDLKLRGIAVQRWVAVPPPVPAGLRFLLEPQAIRQPWEMLVEAEDLREALELKARIAADTELLARLRV